MTVAAGSTLLRTWPFGRTRVRAVTVAWVIAAAAAAFGLGAAAIAIAWRVDVMPHAVIVSLIYPATGALIVARQRRNAVGWLLLAIGLINGVVAISLPWAEVALDVSPGSLPGGTALGQVMAWLADGLWILSHGMLVTLVPLLFPNGNLPSKRWLPAAGLSVLAVGVQFGAPLSVISQIRLRESLHEFYPDERLASTFGTIGYRLVLTAAVIAAASLVWRLARMPRDERGTYVWFAAGAIAAVALLVPFQFIPHALAEEVARVASVVVIPIGAAVAILRHRAYGIDVVLNRTFVYAVLTGVLAGVYLLSAAVVDAVLTASSTFSAVVAAGVTALVLSPARAHLQAWVNQLMYGRRDEPHVVSAAVGNRLEAVAGGAETLKEVTAEIAGALRLAYVGLEAAGGGGVRTVASSGDRPAVEERLPLVANGEVVGNLVVGGRRGQAQLSARDREALREVAPLAAVALRQVQLTDDLRQARGRLATALEEERRRIRRDLHDGLGPSLATVVMGLEEARAVHRDDPDRAERLLADLKTQTRSAIEEIRSLVYGLRPPALDELGLVAALRQLVEATVGRTPIRVSLDAPAALPELSAATEVAAYRIVQEALTNAARHSGARGVRVTVGIEQDRLVVAVSDDGRGFDQVTPGVGMTSLRERAEDIGGSVTFDGSNGTTMHAVLPVRS